MENTVSGCSSGEFLVTGKCRSVPEKWAKQNSWKGILA